MHKWNAALKIVKLGWKTITWKLSEPSIVRYFFNLASARESARSSPSISFKKNLGFGFSANLVSRKSLQSVTLRTLPPIPTYRRAEYFANPPTWSTSPLPCQVTLNRRMTGTPILVQIFWILSKCWSDLYFVEQLSLSMMQLSGMFATVSSTSLRACVTNVWFCFFVVRHIGVVTFSLWSFTMPEYMVMASRHQCNHCG